MNWLHQLHSNHTQRDNTVLHRFLPICSGRIVYDVSSFGKLSVIVVFCGYLETVC
jgi:hypothetical protein